MASRKTKVQSFYFDMQWLSKYWGVDGAQRMLVALFLFGVILTTCVFTVVVATITLVQLTVSMH